MISVGIHRGKAVRESAQFGVTPEKGTDFVRVTFVITDGEFKGQRGEWNGYFTDNTTKRTIEALGYCGCTFPDNDITNLDGIDANEVSLDFEHETTSEGKTYARIAWVNSLSRGISPELQMDDSKKASFKSKMMGQIAFAKQGKPAASSSPAASAPATGKIPF